MPLIRNMTSHVLSGRFRFLTSHAIDFGMYVCMLLVYLIPKLLVLVLHAFYGIFYYFVNIKVSHSIVFYSILL